MKLEDLANKEIEITSDGLLKVVEKKKGKFVPKEGELYWFIDSYGDVCSEFECDEWFINHHPVFRTEEEAEEYKRYLEVLDKYKHEFTDEEWKNRDINKWYMHYFASSDELSKSYAYKFNLPNCTYFKTQEDVESFIEEAGEENVKKFMFDVWE